MRPKINNREKSILTILQEELAKDKNLSGLYIGKDGYFSAKYKKNCLNLEEIFVEEAYRHRGIAKNIIQILISQNYEVVRLVRIVNVAFGEKLKSYQFPGYQTTTDLFTNSRTRTYSILFSRA